MKYPNKLYSVKESVVGKMMELAILIPENGIGVEDLYYQAHRGMSVSDFSGCAFLYVYNRFGGSVRKQYSEKSMLKEIICDKLPVKKIVFHEGLNVIVGDVDAANSIGKSSALLMIDFALGGESYYSKRNDIISHVQAHDVMIHFVFDGVDYHFKRNTVSPSVVCRCDANYHITETLSDTNYQALLLSLYKIPSKFLTFRQIVGQFSRIYNVGNCDEKDPLNPGYPHNSEDRVKFLMKLFNQYAKIAEQDAIKENAKKKLDAYNLAVRLKLIPVFSNKTEYNENEKKIGELNKEMESIKSQIEYKTMNLTSEQLARISFLKSKLARVQNEKSLSLSLVERLKENVSDTSGELGEQDMARIKELFPTAELKQLEEVNVFHARMAVILKEEINRHIVREEKKLERIKREEAEIIDKITKVAAETNPEHLALDRLVETKQSIDQLISGKDSYDTRDGLRKDKKIQDVLYIKITEKVLADLQQQINNEMARLNSLILGSGKKPPMIILKQNKYNVFCEDDEGTGTGFRKLITFDLSVLNQTTLPLLIHDSLLFKNIEDDAVTGIIRQYATENQKQIIISLDKVPHYSEEVQRIVKTKKVLELSKDNTFYGVKWNQ